jgi:lipopolysaccharide transport system ATP-binding protein
MITDIAISVRNLSKCYRIYDDPSDRLKQGLQRLWGGKKSYGREFWALRDVSFDLNKGECLGVLGRNGAGKSTLLQLIAGTLQPTYGNVKVNGVVAALLELGSGFNPEFTGRENVFLNATILGLSPEAINRVLDDILAFADIGEFIEQPVKNYSSGMVMRLAFAVQTAVQPSVLIVDEALAVGDARFQRKCFDRMTRLRESGTTILFVTHDSGTVVQICDKAMIIDAGTVFDHGEPQMMAKVYHRLLFDFPGVHAREEEPPCLSEQADRVVTRLESTTRDAEGTESASVQEIPGSAIKNDREVRYGSKAAEISEIGISDINGSRTNYLSPHQVYVFWFKVRYNFEFPEKVAFGFIISNIKGIEVYATNCVLHDTFLRPGCRGEEFECRMKMVVPLTPGVYFLTAAIGPGTECDQDKKQFYDYRFDAFEFHVGGRVRCHTTSIVDLNANLTWVSV